MEGYITNRRVACQAALRTITFLVWWLAMPVLSQETITNIVSSIVSYQYLEDLGSEALTNGGISTPILSFHYLEAFPYGVPQAEPNSTISYYYRNLNDPVLTVTATTRVPTTDETTPATSIVSPTPSQLLAFHGGLFTENLGSVDPNQMTIVLTHGWVPLKPVLGTPFFPVNGIDDWPTNMAYLLQASGVSANIVAWDWRDKASSSIINPWQAGGHTADEGLRLGARLLNLLGPTYNHPVHFIGHSFGTLVNAYAANYLQGTNWASGPISPTPWPSDNMHMTLFDEAEIGADAAFKPLSVAVQDLVQAAKSVGINVSSPVHPYFHPLPAKFAWADNYISAFGIPQRGAANIILTNGFATPSLSLTENPIDFLERLGNFHSYPQLWYEKTISSDVSQLGFLWSFERLSLFFYGPQPDSVYVQSFNTSDWNLIQTNWGFGTQSTIQRLESYVPNAELSTVVFVGDAFVTGGFSAVYDAAPTVRGWLVNLSKGLNLPFDKGPSHPRGTGAGGGTNTETLAWIPVSIPPNAISLSFYFKIQGDWQSDSLVAAINGTNVLFFPGNQVETNIYFSSGPIDVSTIAGTTNELFLGIMGGTSTNALLTVGNLAFSITQQTLTATPNGSNLILSWPESSQGWTLESTTNLAFPIWTTNLPSPVVVSGQFTVTNRISGQRQFFRLGQAIIAEP